MFNSLLIEEVHLVAVSLVNPFKNSLEKPFISVVMKLLPQSFLFLLTVAWLFDRSYNELSMSLGDPLSSPFH